MDAAHAGSDRSAALEFLYRRINYERNAALPARSRGLGLQRMHELLERLGNPHHRLPAIHVAGTKGKGSTASMIAAVLTAAGYRVGLYTSPHLEQLEERFVVDGRRCTESEFVALVERLRRVVHDMERDAQEPTREPAQEPTREPAQEDAGPTFFELTTALAMQFFVERGVDLAVLEVGMGGRLDSTNVCRPIVSVITSIGLDHTRQLGDTVVEIAGEKAGIIKPGVPVVSGATQADVRQVIREVANRHGARLREMDRDFRVQYRPPPPMNGRGFVGGSAVYSPWPESASGQLEVALNLLGRHQAANAGVAVAALREVADAGWPVEMEAIRRGFASVRCPARIEVLSDRPRVVLDAGHNVGSIEALTDVLRESFPPGPKTLVFGTTREKDAAGMLRRLLPLFQRVIVTRYLDNPRAVPAEEIARLIGELGPTLASGPLDPSSLIVCSDPKSAWDRALRDATPEELICVTGSLFLAGELRARILHDLGADAVREREL